MRDNQANVIINAAYRMMNNKKYENELHNKNYIHIHDNDYTGISYNCIGIKIKEKLEDFKKSKQDFEIEDILDYVYKIIVKLTNEQSGGIGFLNFDEDLESFVNDIEEEKLIKNFRRFYSNLNLNIRNGYEKAYVTFNIGLSTTNNGRKIIKSMLKAFEKGEIIDGSPFIFPNIVFKLKKGINLEEFDKNYDLLQLSAIVTGKRMNPTYFNCDNKLVDFIDFRDVGIMGCRTLLSKNINGLVGGVYRGNIASISINLPKIAKESENIEKFYQKLGEICEKAKEILLEKYKLLCKLGIENFEFILQNNFYMNSKKALEEKKVFEFLKNGTLSIGFIGIFDCISYLKKESITVEFIEKNIKLAEDILVFLKNYVDKWTMEEKLNFSLLATPGEGISGRFAIDDETKKFYTNSFHVPVYLEINALKKIEIESNFIKYCNGGSISYVEFPTPILNNGEAVIDLIKYSVSKNILYLGINFPLDRCFNCGEEGVFKNESCPKCKSKDILQLRRVSGYLSHKKTLKGGKKIEESMRISHIKNNNQ